MTLPLVAIGIPAGDRVHTQFALCLWGIGRGARRHRQGTCLGQSSIVANSRNQIIDGMFAINADYVMMIDSDMTFPSDTVDRLLAHDKDIVGATYVRRGPPFDNLGETLNATGDIQSGLVEMKRIPTGMLLIRAEVFKRLRRPYFRFGIDEIHGANIGEDCTFSDMVRDLDYQIWCDVDLSKEIGHLHQYALTVEDPSVRAISARYQEEMRAMANG